MGEHHIIYPIHATEYWLKSADFFPSFYWLAIYQLLALIILDQLNSAMYLLGICWIELPAHQDRKSGECFAPQSMVTPGFFYWSFGLILLLHLVAQNPLGVSIMRRTFTEWGDWSPDQPPSQRGQGAVLCETSYPPWPIWHGWTYQGPKSLLWCNCNSLVSLRHSRSTTSRWHAWLKCIIDHW